MREIINFFEYNRGIVIFDNYNEKREYYALYDDGSKEYFLGMDRHREDGPAVEYINGSIEYWYEGKFIGTNQKEFDKYISLKAFW